MITIQRSGTLAILVGAVLLVGCGSKASEGPVSDGGANDDGGGGGDGGGSGINYDAGLFVGGDGGGVAIDHTPNKWHTDWDSTGQHFVFVDPNGNKAVLQGISMTGFETGTRESPSGGGFWLYNSTVAPESTNAPTVVKNVTAALDSRWKTDVIRIPICGSAWSQDYQVQDYGNAPIQDYKAWVGNAITQARTSGAVVILDMHLWAIAKLSKFGGPARGTFTSNGKTQNYSDFEDGCTGLNTVGGTDSCAPKDWYTDTTTTWECAIANGDGASLYNAYYNKDSIKAMWSSIATQYKDDSAIWFELFNEPYTRLAPAAFPGQGANQAEADYPWDLWSAVMEESIEGIRDDAQASNIVIVNGLDFGYDFGPQYGPIANPDTYLPWKAKYANIAYAFHPYQHGACCGNVGSGSDQSVTDPYESAYCSYYPDGTTWGAASNAALPDGETCASNGYDSTQDKKMPPCNWVAAAYNPSTKANGLCAGDRNLCGPLTQAQCNALGPEAPQAGGWSQYVLPMHQVGPLIATEFGTFDCSSPYVTTLLKYMTLEDISYTSWALWPQDSGGPPGLGSCGFPSVMSSLTGGDFHTCFDGGNCASLLSPLPWAGSAVFADVTSH